MTPRQYGPAAAADRHAYIPAGAQQALARQMQQSVPAHLRQYVGENKPAYIPERAQQELTAFMQKSTPAHLQQYAGAFVEQSIVNPTIHQPVGEPATSGRRPPVVDKRNLSHSGEVSASQADATQYLNMFQADASPNTSAQPTTTQPGDSFDQAPDPHPDYNFIMNPQQPKRPGLFSFGGTNMAMRILVVAGALVILLVLFAVLKNVLSGSNASVPAILSATQDQQELIHLATNGTQSAVSNDTKNFAYTSQLTLTSEQSRLVAYLKTAGHKTSTKELALKVSKTTDDQLAAALSASNYDATFKEVMQSKLQSYQADLQKAYAKTTGPKGRALLTDEYNGAQLLAKQLGSSP